MLVELSMVEQRYQAVREVLDTGATITDVAARYGVDRTTCITGSLATPTAASSVPLDVVESVVMRVTGEVPLRGTRASPAPVEMSRAER